MDVLSTAPRAGTFALADDPLRGAGYSVAGFWQCPRRDRSGLWLPAVDSGTDVDVAYRQIVTETSGSLRSDASGPVGYRL